MDWRIHRPLVLSVALWGVAQWLYEARSEWWALTLGAAVVAYGAWRYRCGRRDEARRGTCQENVDSIFINDDHVHECVRERGHRSRIHRCACGMEWHERSTEA